MTTIAGSPSSILPSRVRALPLRLGGILVMLLILVGTAHADMFSDGWHGLSGAFKGVGGMGYSGMEKLMPLELSDLVLGKGCSFKIISGHDFGGEQATYKFVGPCKYRVEPGKEHAKPYEVTYDLEIEGLWSGPLASELVVGRKDGKTTFGAQVSYTCSINPWKTGQSCQRTTCASATTKGCEALDTVLQRAGNKDQPITRIVGAVTAEFSGIKIASPKQGETVPDTKPLGITITLPFGQKVQYELTSPAGPAYSQILGPVYGWGKLDEKTFVVTKVPPATLKPTGQWTMTAHLIGVPNSALTQQQVTFTVTHTATAQSGQNPNAPLAPGPITGPLGGSSKGSSGKGSEGQARNMPSPGATGLSEGRTLPPLRLVLAQQQGTSALLLAVRNADTTADNPEQPIELRLGGRPIGRGRVPKLGPGQEERLVLRFGLPAGTRGPVDVEVWIGGRRLGSATVTPLARTP